MQHSVFIGGMIIFWPIAAQFEIVSVGEAKKSMAQTIGVYLLMQILLWSIGC
jgi:hypothetical protein